jgi:hypothetical protein
MITFTRTTQTHDPETGQMTPVETSIAGTGVRVKGDPIRYQQLGLVESEAPTLLFVPTTYGETPAPGDTVTWASTLYTARDVQPVAPDGVTIFAKIVVVR